MCACAALRRKTTFVSRKTYQIFSRTLTLNERICSKNATMLRVALFKATAINSLHLSDIIRGGPRRTPQVRRLAAYAWGNGDYGQLGLPADQLSDEPETFGRQCPQPHSVPAVATSAVASIATSSSHTAFLLADGRLYMCGRGTYGQLGLSDAVDKTEPVMVRQAPPVQSVACGARHTLVATRDGLVLAFGDNRVCQLAQPSGNECHKRTGSQKASQRSGSEMFLVRALAEGGHKIASVAAGEDFSVALSDDGRLFTWGAASYGALGHSRPPPLSPLASFVLQAPLPPEESPRLVRGLADRRVVSVACGRRQTIAVDAGGQAYAWGHGRHFMLGTGVEEDEFEPVRVFANLPAIAKVACGTAHTLVLTKGGLVFAVGESEHGCLGIGSASPFSVATEPVFVEKASPAVDIAAGWHVSAAVMPDGEVRTWGCAAAGALGGGENLDVWEPQRVEGVRARHVVIASAGTSVFAVP